MRPTLEGNESCEGKATSGDPWLTVLGERFAPTFAPEGDCRAAPSRRARRSQRPSSPPTWSRAPATLPFWYLRQIARAL